MILDAVKAWDGWAKWSFENRVVECEKMTNGVYPQNVIDKILNYSEYSEIKDMLLNHLHERRYNKQLTYSNYYVMNKLRVMFARISVSMLEPDLVIMDEFQRFENFFCHLMTVNLASLHIVFLADMIQECFCCQQHHINCILRLKRLMKISWTNIMQSSFRL